MPWAREEKQNPPVFEWGLVFLILSGIGNLTGFTTQFGAGLPTKVDCTQVGVSFRGSVGIFNKKIETFAVFTGYNPKR